MSLAWSTCSSGSGSPTVAARSMTLAISSPSVRSESSRASTRPWRSSLSSSAPPTRIASPARLRMTISRPMRDGVAMVRSRGARSDLAVAVTDAIERFDGVEVSVDLAELLAHALDVAVDGAVVDVDLIIVGRVHQVVAALHEPRTLRQRLQQQELGDGESHRLA